LFIHNSHAEAPQKTNYLHDIMEADNENHKVQIKSHIKAKKFMLQDILQKKNEKKKSIE